MVATAVSRGRGFVLVIGFLILVVGLVLAVGLILARAGLLMVPFQVMGVNQMGECLHGFESGMFALLTHDVLEYVPLIWSSSSVKGHHCPNQCGSRGS